MAAGDPFFRADSTAAEHDLELLPRELRDHQDLVAIARVAEGDLFAEFTKPSSDGIPDGAFVVDAGTAAEAYIALLGFTNDPATTPASLAAAIRRELAAVIRWRIAQERKEAILETETAQGDANSTKTYREDAEGRFPPDFGSTLRRFRLERSGRIAWVI